LCIDVREKDIMESTSAITRPTVSDNSINNNKVLGQTQKDARPGTIINVSRRVPVDRIVQALGTYIDSDKKSLDITVDEVTGNMLIKVISDVDGKVIREIPTEEVLHQAAMLEELEELIF